MFTAANSASTYLGPERRRHVVFHTQNTEYHCRGELCVAVRDPHTGEFIDGHPAIGRRLSGAIRFAPNGEVAKFVLPGEPPDLGDRLFFSEGKIETELRTSPVRDIGRPSRDTVARYFH
jgi:hypothetical protein